MAHAKNSLLRIYAFAVSVSLLLLFWVGFQEGLSGFITVLILAGLEITFSFDNAIVNARVLQNMSRIWQTIFMTVGIFIAVFVVRVLLPVFIVSVTSSTAFREVVDLALHHPAEYSEKLHVAHPMIATFGGIFLLMIFLDFIFEHQKVKWLDTIETTLRKVGRIKNASVTLAIASLFLATYVFSPHHEQFNVLVAGLVGLVTYLFINALDSASEPEVVAAGPVVKSGIVGFLYLELVDASFSLDGVVGAFALTKNILLIAAGLGIGALFVRSMTVHLMRRGVLAKYIYLEHGAHYAIGILALLMLASIKYSVPEFITGGAGIVVIGAAIWESRREQLHAKKA